MVYLGGTERRNAPVAQLDRVLPSEGVWEGARVTPDIQGSS
jgi:hypothetical protein